jgi:hypothetical protein
MIGRKVAVGALFAFLSVSVAGIGTTALAQERGKGLDQHNRDVHAKKYAGWQRTANGSWVQPVGDPRYPGASPSGGAGIMTKDDMDADAFKPAAMINPSFREVGTFYAPPEAGTVTVRYEPTSEEVSEPMETNGVYIDHGSVYSQESSVPPR